MKNVQAMPCVIIIIILFTVVTLSGLSPTQASNSVDSKSTQSTDSSHQTFDSTAPQQMKDITCWYRPKPYYCP